MNVRISLTAKILILAALNILVLGGAALTFVTFELGHDFDSFLLTTARERVLAVSRAFALDLNEIGADQRDELAERYAAAYRVRVVLFSNDGTQLTGTDRPVPEAVKAEIVARPEGPESHGRGRGDRRPPPKDPLGLGPGGGEIRLDPFSGVPPLPEAPPFLVVANGPDKYWIGVRIPVRQRGQEGAIPGTLMFASASLLGTPFYFQPLPWLAVIMVTLAVTIVCWLPFVRDITREVASMTRATGQIAEGRFDIVVRSDRRDELGTLANAIQHMSGRLKMLVTGQKRFLGDVAHELRSPLARITVATSLLERAADGTTQRHVDDLREDVELMTRLTDDLLAFARAELAISGVRVAPTSVRDVVMRAVRLEARGADVHVSVEAHVRVMAEPDLLSRAVSNLLRNAVQQTASDGPIWVRSVRDGDQVCIVVADEGPGVPEGDLQAMFTPFHRPEASRDRRTGGAGLGLAIVRTAIEACGGSVACRNLTPRGFEVSLRLRVG